VGSGGYDYDLYDGRPPRVRDSDTSGAAADSVVRNITELHREILALFDRATDGLTCDEVEVALQGRHQTISARVRELVLKGLIYDSQTRRQTRSGRRARVYRRQGGQQTLF